MYGAIYTLICYYVIGLPLALNLAFKRQKGVYGLWLGFSIAIIVLDIGLFAICEFPNWTKIAKEMQSQIDKTQVKKIESARTSLKSEDYAGNVALTPEARNFIRQKSI